MNKNLLEIAKPILFNTEMVQAILDGRKTVTRRICKDANDYCVPLNDYIDNEKRTYAVQNYGNKEHTDYVSLCEISMPICKGDYLYVRETFNSDWCDSVIYKADGGSAKDAGYAKEPKWKPSIFMPKSAARILLKVTDVRVERLQDIDNAGIQAEGIDIDCPEMIAFNQGMFADLWDSTVNKSDFDKYGWNANPWVWIYEFERVNDDE